MHYSDSWLWRAAFVNERNDATKEEQFYFKQRYLAMRDKTAFLVARIGADNPGLTVHDITHLDALWEMASILTKDSVNLNPPEAFVFGGAVLLHDAAMSLAAYPNGLAELKKQLAWRDSYARLTMYLGEQSEAEVSSEEIENLATAEALRKLHAQQAETLPMIAWKGSGGHEEFLIDDPSVRNFYGPKMGQIAHSHWWPISKVEEELSHDLGPLGGRTENRISLIRIACLLRVADAMHLDQRRAPPFLGKLVAPQGLSANHWAFQERMAVPFIESQALVYSAAPSFELDVAEGWWLAFDAISVVDRELTEIDHLFQARGLKRLRANRVKGAATPIDLSRYVKTEGWVPVDGVVRVSDVPKIVSSLGGSKLYGNRPAAAIRELIQNAADAVDARRRLQNRPDDWGCIFIAIEKREDEFWLVVEDTGVGMSSRVLTGPLIDFGNSLWRSPLGAEEFPGMQAAGVSAIGKYGIGFFSVFMLGAKVRVTSRRYDQSSDSVRVLEFRNGLESRPILFIPKSDASPVDGGSRIEVKLTRDPFKKGGLLHIREYPEQMTSLKQLIASLAPNVNVEIVVREKNKHVSVVRPNDWLDLSEARFIARLTGANPAKAGVNKNSRLRTLVGPDHMIYGRAMIETSFWGSGAEGCISVGGLRASSVSMIRGVLTGRESTASRNEAYALAPPAVLASWATEQAALIAEAELDGEDKARGAVIVLKFGGDVGKLPIARWRGEWMTADELRKNFSKLKVVQAFYEAHVHYDEDIDSCHPKEFSNHFCESDEVFFVPDDLAMISQNTSRVLDLVNEPKRLSHIFREALSDAWQSEISEEEDEVIVGAVLGSDIVRNMVVFQRPEGDT